MLNTMLINFYIMILHVYSLHKINFLTIYASTLCSCLFAHVHYALSRSLLHISLQTTYMKICTYQELRRIIINALFSHSQSTLNYSHTNIFCAVMTVMIKLLMRGMIKLLILIIISLKEN